MIIVIVIFRVANIDVDNIVIVIFINRDKYKIYVITRNKVFDIVDKL